MSNLGQLDVHTHSQRRVQHVHQSNYMKEEPKVGALGGMFVHNNFWIYSSCSFHWGRTLEIVLSQTPGYFRVIVSFTKETTFVLKVVI